MIRVPAHITGFFRPEIKDDPYQTGSLGAGFSVEKYVFTEIKRLKIPDIKIFFGSNEVSNTACTSYYVAKTIKEKYEITEGFEVRHIFEVPIGCGLATSGAGALGTAFALNNEFSLNIDRVKLAQIAHIAEIKCKTGLGSVIAQYEGMFEIRLKAGAPGIGKVARIPIVEEIAILIYGPILTKEILSSSEKLQKVSQAFGEKNLTLLEKFSVEKFCELSFSFAVESELMLNKIRHILDIAQKYDLYGSMLMLGEGLFLFGDNLEMKVKKMIDSLGKDFRPKNVILTKIDNRGVEKVENNDQPF